MKKSDYREKAKEQEKAAQELIKTIGEFQKESETYCRIFVIW